MRAFAVAVAALLMTVAPALADETPPACTFGPGDLPTTIAPGAPHGMQIPVDHVLVLMQENRSFDHYFSRLPRQRPPRGSSNPNPLGGAPIKPFHQTLRCEVADLAHGWNASHQEWDGGKMDGFTAANADPADPSGSRAMGYLTRRDIPYYYKLYRKFAMSDRHFCALLGPTWPNRHFLLAGTAFGHIGNDFPTVTTEFSQRTIFQSLDDAGVSWKIYASNAAFGLVYAYVRNDNIAKIRPIAELYADAAAGTLPQVAYVDPAFLGDEQNDEHPPTDYQRGQRFVAEVVDALFKSPLWSRSALFITYDEHGGYWDHVKPPLACVPDAIPPATGNGFQYDRYGVRVPFVVVSPYAKKGFVSHTPTDQSAILRFIETRFDLPALTRRDANADPLLEMFNFKRPPFRKPPRLTLPTVESPAPGCPGSPSGAFI
jgi:phospholipase C